MTRRYAARVDSCQAPIVEALRKVGETVQALHTVGEGCPDLLVGFRQKNYLMEVKAPAGKLTEDQVDWHHEWQGSVSVVRSQNEALELIGATTPDTVKKRKDFRNIRKWTRKERL
jgi:hypothetical protein